MLYLVIVALKYKDVFKFEVTLSLFTVYDSTFARFRLKNLDAGIKDTTQSSLSACRLCQVHNTKLSRFIIETVFYI